MREQTFARLAATAAALGLALTLGGCAAMAGNAAGSTVGWAAKGGIFTAKTVTKTAVVAGRTVYGAGKGVHDEFSKKDKEPDYVAAGEAVAKVSQR